MGVIEIVKQQERALGKEEGKLEGLLGGKLEGLQEGKQLVVSKFLKTGSFPHAQIAEIAGVPISYVQQLEQDIKDSKK